MVGNFKNVTNVSKLQNGMTQIIAHATTTSAGGLTTVYTVPADTKAYITNAGMSLRTLTVAGGAGHEAIMYVRIGGNLKRILTVTTETQTLGEPQSFSVTQLYIPPIELAAAETVEILIGGLVSSNALSTNVVIWEE